MKRYHTFIGYIVKSFQGETLGTITDFEYEGQNCYFTISDSYQVLAHGCNEVIDLINGNTFIRLAN